MLVAAILMLASVTAHGQTDTGPPPDASKNTESVPVAPAANAGESHQDPWSQAKDLRAGPLTFDFSGQVRTRYERDVGFTLLG